MTNATSITDERLFELIRETYPLSASFPASAEVETDRLVRHIISCERNSTSATRSFCPPVGRLRGRSRAALLGTTGGVAGAAVAAVLVFTAGSAPSVAFAGWTASPTPPASGQLQAAESTCSNADSSLASLTPAVADTRGPYTMLVYAASDTITGCITGQPSAGAAPIFMGRIETGGVDASPAAAGTISWRQSTGIVGGSATPGGLPAASFVDGQTGTGVTAVTVELEDGSSVQATIANGWFAAWWPGRQRVKTAEVATASGTTTQPPSSTMATPPAHQGTSGLGSAYPTNAAGETYGSAAGVDASHEPDLISAIGTGLNGNGPVTGYVLKSQLDANTGADVTTPAQAVAWTKAHTGPNATTVSIPLYAQDGTTVVGTFTIKPAGPAPTIPAPTITTATTTTSP